MLNQCEKVITIPQFTGTCWFNSILMVCLYSHRMRQLLLNKIKFIDSKYKNDPLMKIFINQIFQKQIPLQIQPAQVIPTTYETILKNGLDSK